MIATRIAAACILILGLTVSMVRSRGHGAERAAIEGPIEAYPFAVVSATGGEVSEILVRQGDRVQPGQLLVRLKPLNSNQRLERNRAAMDRLPPNFFQTAAGMLDRVRPQTWAELTANDPELRSAEQEYVDALAASQAQTSEGARKRLQIATKRRETAYRNRAILGPDSFQAAKDLLRDGRATADLLNKLQDSLRLAAAEAGTVEILDLHPGDVVPPLGRVALLSAANRWLVRAYGPAGAVAAFRPGMQVPMLLSNGRRINANVENAALGELTAISTDESLRAQTGTRARIIE